MAEAAERLFAERGYAAVAIRDVATAADIPAGAVFYHYPKKADLASAVAQRHRARIQEALDGIPAIGGGPRNALERLTTVLWSDDSGMARHGFGVARLSIDLAADGDDAAEARAVCRQALEAVEESVRRLLAEGLDPRAATSAATRVLMVWQGALVMAKAKGGEWMERAALPEVLSVLRDVVRMAEPYDASPQGAGAPKVCTASHARGRTAGSNEMKPGPLPELGGVEPPPPPRSAEGTGRRPVATPAEVLQAVGTILDQAGTPLKRRQLLAEVERILLAERGLGMPGRNPFENLLTIVSKDKARTFVNLTPHGIWIRARSYQPLGYAAGADWKHRPTRRARREA
ncbi:TetR/AcrR family transcriptional regulator [Methylobacterium planeticum]|uniref:TetR/AcrR family transcriptional regulator n=1 Tax=Methylobacterium planeticum TaxID=2615211 RepID=UPI001782E70C|nr:TetR/AcrR family transcriptional regulator [Methylobacterium planeticum]